MDSYFWSYFDQYYKNGREYWNYYENENIKTDKTDRNKNMATVTNMKIWIHVWQLPIDIAFFWDKISETENCRKQNY